MGEKTEQPSELKFPLDFAKCPNCGSTQRLADSVMKAEVARGRPLGKSIAVAAVFQAAIGTPTLIGQQIPMLSVFADFCVNCGALYCVHAEVQMATATRQQPGVQFGGNPKLN